MPRAHRKLRHDRGKATNMRDLVINPKGGTLGAKQDAQALMESIYRNGDESGAKLLEVDDKFVVAHQLPGLGLSIWVEDSNDVCIQVYPPGDALRFQDPPGSLPRDLETPPVAFQAADQVFAEALGNIPNVYPRADWYDYRANHRIKLVHEPGLFGMDLLLIRFINLCRAPQWQIPVTTALRNLNEWVVSQWET
jgi:hypothetical protein